MLDLSIDDLTIGHLRGLVADEVRERKTLEFKRDPIGNSDKDKREFLADVSSLANASGGWLLLGIEDDDGRAVEVQGLSGVGGEAEILRLENILRDAVDPRIPGISTKLVEGGDLGPVVVIRVPMSWAGPHMVTYRGSSRFFGRNSAGKYQLDVREIGDAFLSASGVTDRLRDFRVERLNRVQADETPVLLFGGKVVLHVLPLGSFRAGPPTWDPNEMARVADHDLAPLGVRGWDDRFNLDGLLTYTEMPAADQPTLAYTQVFRNAVIESVNSRLIQTRPDRDGAKELLATALEQRVLKALGGFLAFYGRLGVEPPVFVAISVIGTKGATIPGAASWSPWPDRYGFDRDVMQLPVIKLGDAPRKDRLAAVELGQALRPAFDALWQADGHGGSPNFDENGRWRG